MLRICFCLLIAFASATVAARDVKLSTANGGSCPDSIAAAKAGAQPAPRAPAPARASKPKPSMHSDADNSGRLQSPRWHSFLPGMFR